MASVDNASVMSSSVLVAIMSLVFTVRQVRSYAVSAEDSTRKIVDLQNRLQALIEGTVQKHVKALISSAHTTWLHAQDMQQVFIAQVLDIIGRKPDSMPLMNKRVNQYAGKKRSRTVKTTTTTIQSYFNELPVAGEGAHDC